MAFLYEDRETKMQLIWTRLFAAVTFLLIFNLVVLAAERPVVVQASIPAYPVRAVAKKISGTVLVDVQVNAEGTVTEANSIMGHQLLSEAAKKAAFALAFQASRKRCWPSFGEAYFYLP